MNKFSLFGGFCGLFLFTGASLAGPKHEKPLDYTLRGVTVRPQLMPYIDRDRDLKAGSTLPFDLQGKQILLPAAEASTGGVKATIAIRPTRHPKIVFRLSW